MLDNNVFIIELSNSSLIKVIKLEKSWELNQTKILSDKIEEEQGERLDYNQNMPLQSHIKVWEAQD